jgi:hypothetical protein
MQPKVLSAVTRLLQLCCCVLVAPLAVAGVTTAHAAGTGAMVDRPLVDAALACGGGGGNGAERKPARPGTKHNSQG